MSTSSARFALAATLALAIAGTSVGCGSSSSNSANANPVTQSVKKELAKRGESIKAAVGPVEVLQVSSPATGALAYVPTSLKAKAGNVTIDYTNPSPLPHNVAILDSAGKEVSSEMTPFANGKGKTTAKLAAGSYTYICQVPGHSAAGMKGTLTVS
ncbi:MAG: plastocyanin/azurin family copper-binding protein [Actinomycetes bacterium]